MRMRGKLPLEVRRLIYKHLLTFEIEWVIMTTMSSRYHVFLDQWSEGLLPHWMDPDVFSEFMEHWCEVHRHNVEFRRLQDYLNYRVMGTRVTAAKCCISVLSVRINPDMDHLHLLPKLYTEAFAPFTRGEQRIASNFSLTVELTNALKSLDPPYCSYKLSLERQSMRRRKRLSRYMRPQVAALTALAPIIDQIQNNREHTWSAKIVIHKSCVDYSPNGVTLEQCQWSAEQWADHILSHGLMWERYY